MGIRIPVDDIKNLESLAKQILSLLYTSCDLKGLEINEVLRNIINQINEEGAQMVQEIKEKMIFNK